ncbi:T9SS type A sorting domain-containing protein [bacterium SCSIO 12741]|nr:T9SS type A sorting domain-containing protein [bacterium SCSIO 12741]
MKVQLSFLFIILFSYSLAQKPMHNWSHTISGTNDVEAGKIVVDKNGNTYSVGSFLGSIDLDPGPNSHILNSGAHSLRDDSFIQKKDPNGNLIWGKNIGGPYGRVIASHIALDSHGNLFIYGNFSFLVDFDPDTSTYYLNAEAPFADAFILKLDSNSKFTWVKTFGSKGYVRTYDGGMKLNNRDEIYLCGAFRDSIDIDPDSNNLKNLVSNGNHDVFVSKLKSDGTIIWAKSFGGALDVYSYDIAVDQKSNLFICGGFEGQVDFDPGSGQNLVLSRGLEDGYICVLDSNGDFTDVSLIGGKNSERCKSIELDNRNNLIAAGFFKDTVDFDPDTSKNIKIARGTSDLFLVEFDSVRKLNWVKTIGGPKIVNPSFMEIDEKDNIYLTGKFYGTVDFDPDTGIYTLSSPINRSKDFIGKFDANGQMLWVYSLDGYHAYLGGMTHDHEKNIYLTGSFQGNFDSDLGPQTNFLNSLNTSSNDGFIIKMDTCIGVSSVHQATQCESFYWSANKKTYYSSTQKPEVILSNKWGCDSVVKLHLTILDTSSGVDSVTACDEFVWIDQKKYVNDNSSAQFVTTNALGCDSLVSLKLTINRSSKFVDEISSCTPITWLDGKNYSADNSVATYTLINQFGCDSVIHLDFDFQGVDVSYFRSDSVLEVMAFSASYQWFDCQNNFSRLLNDTLKYFIPKQNGSYACEVTEGMCTDTSSCFEIRGLSTMDNLNKFNVSAYPNPTSGTVTIDLGSINDYSIEVYNIEGQLVHSTSLISERSHSLHLNQSSGLYIMRIKDEKGIIRIPIIVNKFF